MKKGAVIQVIIIASVAVLFAFLTFAPKNFSAETLEKKEEIISTNELNSQIKELKEKLSPENKARVESFEKVLNESSDKSKKIACLDSLVAFWDRNMYPQVGAVFFEQKADLANDLSTWTQAGERFLGISALPGFEDRVWALTKAEKAFEKALNLNPGDNNLKINKAIVLVERGEKPMEGVAILKEIVESDPKNTRAILSLGHFNVKSGELERAISRYKQALEADPNLTEINFYIADTYGKIGNFAEAKKYIELYKKTLNDTMLINQVNTYMKENYNIQ
jgi:tetratricopeptide (TPR) repeat protein